MHYIGRCDMIICLSAHSLSKECRWVNKFGNTQNIDIALAACFLIKQEMRERFILLPSTHAEGVVTVVYVLWAQVMYAWSTGKDSLPVVNNAVYKQYKTFTGMCLPASPRIASAQLGSALLAARLPTLDQPAAMAERYLGTSRPTSGHQRRTIRT